MLRDAPPLTRDRLRRIAGGGIAILIVAGSTGRRNTFWSNIGPGGKEVEQEEAMRAIGRTESVVVETVEGW
jgi:hypothetical protein